MLMRICPGDTDWLQVSSDPEAPSIISFVFEHGKGDLAVRLTDATGLEVIEEVDASSPENNGESVALPVEEEPKAYAIEVRGKDNAENFYLLRMDRPQGGDGGGEGDPPEEQEEDEQDEESPPEDHEDQENQDQPPEKPKEEEAKPESIDPEVV